MERLSLKHKERVNDALARYPQETSELAFGNLFSWRTTRPLEVLDVDDTLFFLLERDNGDTLFSNPLGPCSLQDAVRIVKQHTGRPLLTCERITEPAMGNFSREGVQVIEDRNNSDYVYPRNALADLKGRKYHKKRNLIAQCLSSYDCTYEPITPATIPEVRAMQDRWCADHICKKQPGLCHEYIAVHEMLEHYESLGIIGGAVRINGQVEAYAIAERLNDTTAVIHFEKAMKQFKGLYQVINQWFAQHALSPFETINREQDMGIEGLRRAKESYYPERMIKKYTALLEIDRSRYEQIKIDDYRCNQINGQANGA